MVQFVSVAPSLRCGWHPTKVPGISHFFSSTFVAMAEGAKKGLRAFEKEKLRTASQIP
jgi:hypothetical protein